MYMYGNFVGFGMCHGHQQDDYMFNPGDPFKENLHLPVLLGGSSYPNLRDTNPGWDFHNGLINKNPAKSSCRKFP